jgi:1,4-dihydroxy-2-naphthoyl-CoA synthase
VEAELRALGASLADRAALSTAVHRTPEGLESMHAFLEKRQPSWDDRGGPL